MKSIDIIKAAVANTFRSRLRTTLTVIAIVIGAFTLTITSAIGTGVSNYINAQVASIGSTDVLHDLTGRRHDPERRRRSEEV